MLRRIVGCMTGTSMDGIDAALIEVSGQGLDMQVAFIAGISRPLGALEEKFQLWSRGAEMSCKSFTQASREFGALHATIIKELIGSEKIDLICAHGQTLYHKPPDTLQLLNPFPIASAFEIPVVYDLRQMDVCCGGEGAPLTPIADYVIFKEHADCVIINGGGFCNVSLVTKDLGGLKGFDLCVCNLLLNQICMDRFHQPFDRDGLIAKMGKLDKKTFSIIKYSLLQQKEGGRSLGSDDELRSLLFALKEVSGHDLLYSACEAIASVIAENVLKLADKVILAGGGFNHPVLKACLLKLIGKEKLLEINNDFLQYREAMGFAVLGALCQDRTPITTPKIHHSKKTLVSGAWVLP